MTEVSSAKLRTHMFAAMVASLFTVFVVLPILLYVSYFFFPPELVVEHRRAIPTQAVPGQKVQVAGTYQQVRRCLGTFASIREWESSEGLIQATVPIHYGSVPLDPGPPIRIGRVHVIPLTAIPGSVYTYRTTARWNCTPWLGFLSPEWQQTYRHVTVEVAAPKGDTVSG